jgi:hypothetical protein
MVSDVNVTLVLGPTGFSKEPCCDQSVEHFIDVSL